MPDLTTRVAIRHSDREAGLFAPPPAMTESISKWMLSTYAGNVLAYAQARLSDITSRKKILEKSLKDTDAFDNNIERILKKLKLGDIYRIRVGLPTDSMMLGVKRVDTENDRYRYSSNELYQVGTGSKRLKFDKWEMYEFEAAVSQLRDRLRRLGNTLHQQIKRTGEGVPEYAEGRLVEFNLVIKAASKYTTKAKAYKSKATKKIPVDLTGWKYLTTASPLITKLNEDIFKYNTAIEERITNALVNLKRAQKLYKDLKSGKQPIPSSIDDMRELERQYDVSGYRGDFWHYDSVSNLISSGSGPPTEKETVVIIPAKQHMRVPIPEAREQLKESIKQGDINAALKAAGWGHISCILWFIWHKRRGGQWNWATKLFEVDVRNAHPSTVKEFEDGIWEIQRVIRHELQHVGQDILQVVKQLRENAGLPSKEIRTPDTTPYGTSTSGRGTGRVKHELQEVEFETDLADSIDRFERDVLRKRLDQRREFLRSFVGLKGRATNDHFRVWQADHKEKWKQAIKKLMAEIARRGIEIPGEGLGRIAGGKRTLYHIGKRPAAPKPHKSGEAWSRAHGKIKNGVFLSSNPAGIWINHGVFGNVYSYDVPEWVIAESGGMYRYDWGTEVVIPTAVWEKAGKEIRLKGKVSEKKFSKQVQEVYKDQKRRHITLESNDPFVTPSMKGWRALLWDRQKKPKDPRKVMPFLKPGECQKMLTDLTDWLKDRDNIDRWKLDRPGFARIKELEGLLTECAMSQRLASDMRCTEATLRAFGIDGICPIHGTGVLDALKESGYSYRPLGGDEWLEAGAYGRGGQQLGKKVGDFIQEHPKGAFYLMTSRHAMGLVDGKLTDTAGGTARRRLQGALEVLWKGSGPPPYRGKNRRQGDAMTHDIAQRIARRHLKEAAIKNDPAAIPPVGTRVLDVQYDTKYDPMADITFEDGRTLAVHLHMTPTTPGDSDTEAWQKEELVKLQDEETGKSTYGPRMASRVAARYLESKGLLDKARGLFKKKVKVEDRKPGEIWETDNGYGSKNKDGDVYYSKHRSSAEAHAKSSQKGEKEKREKRDKKITERGELSSKIDKGMPQEEIDSAKAKKPKEMAYKPEEGEEEKTRKELEDLHPKKLRKMLFHWEGNLREEKAGIGKDRPPKEQEKKNQWERFLALDVLEGKQKKETPKDKKAVIERIAARFEEES